MLELQISLHLISIVEACYRNFAPEITITVMPTFTRSLNVLPNNDNQINYVNERIRYSNVHSELSSMSSGALYTLIMAL